MNALTVLHRIELGAKYPPTGFTRHIHNGVTLPSPAELRIVQYSGDPGFYLFYCDSSGREQTDTYHDSVQSAMGQANAEFGVQEWDWSKS